MAALIAPLPSVFASGNRGASSSPCPILTLQLEDLKLADAQLHVLGKGRKQRILPLPGEIIEVLQNYIRLERLFVSLTRFSHK